MIQLKDFLGGRKDEDSTYGSATDLLAMTKMYRQLHTSTWGGTVSHEEIKAKPKANPTGRKENHFWLFGYVQKEKPRASLYNRKINLIT